MQTHMSMPSFQDTRSRTALLIQIVVILLSANKTWSINQLRGSQTEEGPEDEYDGKISRAPLYSRKLGNAEALFSLKPWSIPFANESSYLVDRPVYFEKQMDDPDDRTGGNPYARIVGGSNSPMQRNFCMHLRWDALNEQYVNAGCGGVLISNCHVLTAAHCSANGRMGLPDGVYCNAYNPFQGNYGKRFHFSALKNTILHPSFDDSNNQHDVSILQMENCVDISLFPPMKVANKQFMSRLVEGQSLVVSGFGRTQPVNTGVQVERLQSAQVPYIAQQTCSEYYPGKVTEDMICAGFLDTGGVDACQGDSGGPLFFQGSRGGDRNQTLIGAVSWGSGCAQANRPGVYSSVAYHHSWIRRIVCSDTRTDSSLALCLQATAVKASSPNTMSTTTAAIATACAALHQLCETKSCCGNYKCYSRSVGAAPLCGKAVSDWGGLVGSMTRTELP
jgi:secreted trypsin-like serine protease